MKAILVGVIALLSLHLKAQHMKNPNEVVTSLFVATDQRAWNSVQEIFDTAVLLDYSSMTGNPATKTSPDQIVTAWKGILPGFDATHHQIGNFITKIENNRAKVFCYGTASHYLAGEDHSVWTVVGTYDFELIKQTSGSWKINAMKFNFKYQNGNTSLPEKAIQKVKE